MLKSYVFDLDQNILHTKTPIYLLNKQDNGEWKEIPIPNAEFEKKLEDHEHFKYYDNIVHSMREFRGKDKLIRDISESIANNAFGPSWPKFKKATIDAAPTHIITARGHPIDEIRKTHKHIIYEVFTQSERQELAYNMSNNSEYYSHQTDKLIAQYLNNNIYIPCSNTELIKKRKRTGIGTTKKKAIAFEKCLRKSIHTFSKYYGTSFMKHKHMSIGFSDDNKKNIDAITQLIINKLADKYPNILFYIYNTEYPQFIKKETIQKSPTYRPPF